MPTFCLFLGVFMKKVDILNQAYEMLKASSIPDWEDSAKRLLAHCLGIEYADLYTLVTISDDMLDNYIELINERCKHTPLDKIIGYTYFYNVKIPFNRNTLTPRMETEILVDRVLLDIKLMLGQTKAKTVLKPIDVLDLCTGSGCIGLSIAHNAGVNVTMSDIDKNALSIAKNNNEINNELRKEKALPPINPNFILSDMFKSIPYTFDMIICNPPYIKTKDLQKLEIEVRDFDPMIALDGGKDGLNFYKILANESHKHLKSNGTLYLEIGIDQSDKIVKLLDKHFDKIEVIKDLSGIDRYIIAKKRD